MKRCVSRVQRSLGIVILLFIAGTKLSFAVDLLDSAETIFFNQEDRTRVGIESEFTGLSAHEAAIVVQKIVGGKIEERTVSIKTTLKKIKSDGTRIYNFYDLREFVIHSTIGEIVLKPETNQITDVDSIKKNPQVVELVSEPIRYPDVMQLQKALSHLQEAGAKGTSKKRAVSTQVNVEIDGGDLEKTRTNIQPVVDLFRSYARPEHRKQIDARLNVPKARKPYVEGPSDGFLKKLLDPSYRPTAHEFFNDYMYRQSLELLEGKQSKQAWTLPIDQVKKRVISNANPIVPRVVKQNYLRASSLLMALYPDDPLSKIYEDAGWAVPRPLIEFREANNDFKVESLVKQDLGLVSAAKTYGYYDHDKLVSKLIGAKDEACALSALQADVGIHE